ncbi:AAA family ATPase [Pseudomonas protegens]|uniref:AAA family ATPase n=1 Tax=Pseudomonas protegens TaxID=380021 RepID=UPI0027681B4D|nr:AAA family ATPase [Pseudomonas protegens]MDP9514785.1 AAA family ATPase [Pseudomonas protegens]
MFLIGVDDNDIFPTGQHCHFALKEDNWDDFGIQTQFYLYYLGTPEAPQEKLIGQVKILKKGQTKNNNYRLRNNFESLSSKFISMGQSLDYYERLSTLPEDARAKLLSGLRDYVKYPELGKYFRDEIGWKSSLFREFSEDDEFILMAKSILLNDFTLISSTDLKFTFQPAGLTSPIKFDFSTPPPLISKEFPPYIESTINSARNQLPNRVISIIGRNGSGKSTLLARLARVAHATPKNRNSKTIKSLGSIAPHNLGFTRIITISYSAFDSFRLPGIKPQNIDQPDERIQIIKDIKEGGGRFAFSGLRDIASELLNQINSEKDEDEDEDERLSSTLLKPIDVLADEFTEALEKIYYNAKSKTLNKALECISRDPSFMSDEKVMTTQSLIIGNPKKTFLSWSTGHKIVMHMLVNIAANAAKASLILIDEPETHLHPPLLAALMHAIREILEQTNAHAIIATHSPIVLQETTTNHTKIIKREGDLTTCPQPTIETFGASIGEITGEVFGLHAETTNFYKTLDKLINSLNSQRLVEELFQPYGLSFQARAYVMSQLAKKGS